MTLSLRIRNSSFNANHCLRALAANPQVLQTVLRDDLIRAASANHGLKAEDSEIDRWVAEFARTRGIDSTGSALEDWMRERDSSLHELQSRAELYILEGMLRLELVVPRVLPYFEENAERFDQVVLLSVLCDNVELASARMESLAEGAVMELILDSSATIEMLSRSDLHPIVEAAVFSASQMELVGPIETAEFVALACPLRFHAPQLTPAIRQRIEDSLFEDWLRWYSQDYALITQEPPKD